MPYGLGEASKEVSESCRRHRDCAGSAAQTAIRHDGELEDLRAAAVFISLDAFGYYITGHTLFVDGDFSAK